MRERKQKAAVVTVAADDPCEATGCQESGPGARGPITAHARVDIEHGTLHDERAGPVESDGCPTAVVSRTTSTSSSPPPVSRLPRDSPVVSIGDCCVLDNEEQDAQAVCGDDGDELAWSVPFGDVGDARNRASASARRHDHVQGRSRKQFCCDFAVDCDQRDSLHDDSTKAARLTPYRTSAPRPCS